ncbi:MAG: hypothetical protein O3B13_02205 [Planctomycetota bacterium]|nr:hypothetical protein [Planctomycetota bacterium]
MKLVSFVVCSLVLSFGLLSEETAARGPIGGGGRSPSGGGFSGRGFSGGGISRGGYQPSRSMPSRNTSGIGTGSSRPVGSGSIGSSRSSVSIRPGIGSSSTRPQIGSGSRVGSGSSQIGSGSVGSGRLNTSQFPGLGNRSTTTLPGLNNGNTGQRLADRYPNLNRDNLRQQIGSADQTPTARREKQQAWQQQQADRRANTPERRQELQDRFSQVDREDWQEHRNQNREDRQDYRGGAREDWQNWHDNNYSQHYGWHHGCWHDGWHHLWDEHPVAAAFGLTWWGANTMSYMFGTSAYANPYYFESSSGGGIDYSQPQVVVEQPASDSSPAKPADVPEAGLTAFEQARASFLAGDFDAARQQTDEALKLMPHDAVIHEFRALTLFALKRYSEAAAVLHSVLAVGPGWDWTTMSQLYSSTEVYTEELRALESWSRDHASLPEGHFVLAYHYLTCGHEEQAASELKLVVKALPDDAVSAHMLSQLTNGDTAATGSKAAEAPAARSVSIKQESLIGRWTAKVGDSAYKLELSDDGRFNWSFTSKEGDQGVLGVYAINDSTLAMEPDGGGVMLAELRLDGTQLSFQQVGDDPGAAPLKFERD